MTVSDHATRFVTFRVGTELFAIDVQHVEQVLRYQPARRMPRLPTWIDGILEYQGRVVPMIDLRKHFEVSVDVGNIQQARLLLLNIEGAWCAVAVDQVLDVRPYDLAPESDAPRAMVPHAGALYAGVAKRRDVLVAIIDVAHLFSAAERSSLRRTTERNVSKALAER